MADKNPITSEMIERVARALCRADGNPRDIRVGGPLGDELETRIDKIWFAWRAPARAAIAAMQEPTDDISKAGDGAARAGNNPGTPEMVERVAGAIDPEQWFIDPPSPFREACRKNARRLARNALAAMREPTEAMSKAGDLAARGQGAHDCEVPMSDVWRAMVDAALRE